jgi:hypothetical protein
MGAQVPLVLVRDVLGRDETLVIAYWQQDGVFCFALAVVDGRFVL